MTQENILSQQTSPASAFAVGDEVSYGLHGKCVITGIETKDVGGASVSFYQVRAIRNPITAKSTVIGKGEAAILVPVTSATVSGLRRMMTKDEAEAALRLISEPDYHFELKNPWLTKQKLLEDVIRKEGGIGLAKVIGHLHVVMSRDVVPPSPVMKLYESCTRIFLRELADAMGGLTTKEVEPLLARALKTKLLADN